MFSFSRGVLELPGSVCCGYGAGAAELPDDGGFTPLILAAQLNHSAVVRCLLETGGAAVELADGAGATPLLVSSREESLDAARLLLDNGADVNRADGCGAAPLY